MRRRYILVWFWLIVILAMCVPSVDAQWALVGFIYYDDGVGDPEPPITDGADQPAPDGTMAFVMRDQGDPGPDPADLPLGEFAFNSVSLGFPAGYFIIDSWIVTEAGTALYVAVLLPNRCWHTVSYITTDGLQQIVITADEWTANLPSCPWNLPTASVVFSYCIHPPWYFERPLTCPCNNGPMMPEGTAIQIMHDVNADGPDGMDTSVTSFVPEENWPDCIWVSPWVTLPSDYPVYLQVGEGCCWTTGNYMVTPPQQGIELLWGNWSCDTSPCGLPADEHPVSAPSQLELTAIYPNPFNSITRIEFTMPRDELVSIEVYSTIGQRVAMLANDRFSAGTHSILWNGRSDAGEAVGSGVYFCRLTSRQATLTAKLLLLR